MKWMIFFLLTTSAFAEEINVKVNGMVCSMCSQGIKKKFAEEKGVTIKDVNLDEKLVRISVADGSKIEDARIKELIQSAGYNVSSIERK